MSRGILSGAMLPIVLHGANSVALPLDSESNSLVTTDYLHWRGHRGEVFTATYLSPDAFPIADDANINMLLETDGNMPHITFAVSAGGNCDILFYSGVTTSSDGTPVTAYNTNEASSNVATLTAHHTPTITDLGTLKFSFLQPGGTGGNAIGGVGFSPFERILAHGTKYLIRGVNRSGTPRPMGILVQWYES